MVDSHLLVAQHSPHVATGACEKNAPLMRAIALTIGNRSQIPVLALQKLIFSRVFSAGGDLFAANFGSTHRQALAADSGARTIPYLIASLL